MTTNVQENTEVAPAINSPKDLLAAIDARLSAKQQEIAVAATSGEDIGTLAVAYAGMVAERKLAHRNAFQEEFTNERAVIGQSIMALVASSKLSEYLDAPVRNLVWMLEEGTGDNGPIMSVGVNVDLNKRASTPRKAKEEGATDDKEKSTRTKDSKFSFSVDGGAEITALEFVDAYAPESVRSQSYFKPNSDGVRKWPTQPKFLKQTQDALEADGHTVVVTEK